MAKYFASGGLNTGKFLTTFLISYLLECEGMQKDEIEDNGKVGISFSLGAFFKEHNELINVYFGCFLFISVSSFILKPPKCPTSILVVLCKR